MLATDQTTPRVVHPQPLPTLPAAPAVDSEPVGVFNGARLAVAFDAHDPHGLRFLVSVPSQRRVATNDVLAAVSAANALARANDPATRGASIAVLQAADGACYIAPAGFRLVSDLDGPHSPFVVGGPLDSVIVIDHRLRAIVGVDSWIDLRGEVAPAAGGHGPRTETAAHAPG